MNYETLVTRCNPTLDTPIPVAIDFYIDVKAQYHKSYLNSQRYRLNRISSYYSAMTIRSLTVDSEARERIYEFMQWRLKKVKHGTVRKDMQVLQAFLNWLRKDIGLVIPDIFKRIRIPSDYGNRMFVPTEEQVYKVIGNLPSEDLKDVCLLLAETACRRSEVLKLRICDVFINERYIFLADTKNGDSRKVPLSRSAAAILEKRVSYVSGRSHLYPLFQLMPEFVSKQFRKAADREGLHEFVLHSLRHYQLSRLIQSGHDSILVSKVSGHKDHRILNRYIKVNTELLAIKLFD